jgi:hypothetical protein
MERTFYKCTRQKFLRLYIYVADDIFTWNDDPNPPNQGIIPAGLQQEVFLNYGEFYLALGSVRLEGIVRIFGFDLATPERYIVANQFAVDFWYQLQEFAM